MCLNQIPKPGIIAPYSCLGCGGHMVRSGFDGSYECLDCGGKWHPPGVKLEALSLKLLEQIKKEAAMEEKESERIKAGGIPQRPEGIKEAHKFYKDNKERIIADIERLGHKQARTAWSIPFSTFSYLTKKWNVHKERVFKNRSNVPSMKLPQGFPDWEEIKKTDNPVQCAWLQAFATMYAATVTK